MHQRCWRDDLYFVYKVATTGIPGKWWIKALVYGRMPYIGGRLVTSFQGWKISIHAIIILSQPKQLRFRQDIWLPKASIFLFEYNGTVMHGRIRKKGDRSAKRSVEQRKKRIMQEEKLGGYKALFNGCEPWLSTRSHSALRGWKVKPGIVFSTPKTCKMAFAVTGPLSLKNSILLSDRNVDPSCK